jgi:hypothetical protein
LRDTAARIGIGSLAHLSMGAESNAAVLREAHDLMREAAAALQSGGATGTDG